MMKAMSKQVRLNDGQMKQTTTYSDRYQWTDLWAQTLRDRRQGKRGKGIRARGGQLRLEDCALILVTVPLPKQGGAPDNDALIEISPRNSRVRYAQRV